MKLHIEIEVDNEAFIGDCAGECLRILDAAGERLIQPDGVTLFDINGNRVGFAGLSNAPIKRAPHLLGYQP